MWSWTWAWLFIDVSRKYYREPPGTFNERNIQEVTQTTTTRRRTAHSNATGDLHNHSVEMKEVV
jgi:hypothetical protein